MKKIISFFSLISLGLLIGCAGKTKKEEQELVKQAVVKDVTDEVRIGREVAAKLLGHFGPLNDLALDEYVTLVGQTLVQRIGRPEIDYHFAVLKGDEINAYACPGGYVFVTRSLLMTLGSESELAGVLAHEIAHINERHMYNEIAPKRDVSAGETLARMMSRGHSDLTRSITQIVGKGLKILLETGLGKEKEFAADEAGTIYASDSGYNPTALLKLMRRLESKATSVKLSKASIPFSERVANLEKALSENGIENKMTGDPRVLEQRFAAAIAKLRTAAN